MVNERDEDAQRKLEEHKEGTDFFAARIKNFYCSFREQGFTDDQSVLFIASMLNRLMKDI